MSDDVKVQAAEIVARWPGQVEVELKGEDLVRLGACRGGARDAASAGGTALMNEPMDLVSVIRDSQAGYHLRWMFAHLHQVNAAGHPLAELMNAVVRDLMLGVVVPQAKELGMRGFKGDAETLLALRGQVHPELRQKWDARDDGYRDREQWDKSEVAMMLYHLASGDASSLVSEHQALAAELIARRWVKPIRRVELDEGGELIVAGRAYVLVEGLLQPKAA